MDDDPARKMILYYSARPLLIDVSVPDVIRIHDYHWTMPALIHTSRVIHSRASTQPGRSDRLLQSGMHMQRPFERTSLSACTDEDVMFVLAHSGKMTVSLSG